MPLSREQFHRKYWSFWDRTVGFERDQLLSERYPVSTAEAVRELRMRGYDADATYIETLLRRGKFSTELLAKKGRERIWSADAIDELAALLEQLGRFTPLERALQILGVNSQQYLDALGDAYSSINITQASLRMAYLATAEITTDSIEGTFRMIIEPFDKKLGHRPVRFKSTKASKVVKNRDNAVGADHVG